MSVLEVALRFTWKCRWPGMLEGGGRRGPGQSRSPPTGRCLSLVTLRADERQAKWWAVSTTCHPPSLSTVQYLIYSIHNTRGPVSSPCCMLTFSDCHLPSTWLCLIVLDSDMTDNNTCPVCLSPFLYYISPVFCLYLSPSLLFKSPTTKVNVFFLPNLT